MANVRELRAISHSDRKSNDVDAEKLARYARLDPEILRQISHRTVERQEALTLIRARELLVRFTMLETVRSAEWLKLFVQNWSIESATPRTRTHYEVRLGPSVHSRTHPTRAEDAKAVPARSRVSQ